MRLVLKCDRIFRTIFLLLAVGCLAGCALLNEGAVNYRKAKPPSAGQGGPAPTRLELVEKNIGPSDRNQLISRSTNDSLEVTLQSAFIKDFVEFPALLTKGEFVPRGEVAIIVNVFELGKGKDLGYAPGDFTKGRLVYFNDDVRKGQFLNFANLPVYGPASYSGKKLGIEITIMELDAESKALKALLNSLAGLGKVAYPQASPMLEVLNRLGGAMLGGSHDDRIFKYYMTLEPGDSYRGMREPVLAEGDYVFLRKEDRNAAEDWDGLEYDDAAKRLRVKSAAQSAQTDNSRYGKRLSLAQSQDGFYRGDSYLVFSINRNKPVTDYNPQEDSSYEVFRAKYEQAQSEGRFKDIEAAAKEFAQTVASGRTYENLRTVFFQAASIPMSLTDARNSAFSQFMLNVFRAARCLKQDTDEKKAEWAGGCLSQADLERLCLTIQNHVPKLADKEAVTPEAFKDATDKTGILKALNSIPSISVANDTASTTAQQDSGTK